MLGHFEFKILHAVESLRSEAYGVAMKKHIQKEFSKTVSYGALYTTLSRLEKKGFVESKMGEPIAVRGGRAKKYYKLTASGMSELVKSRSVVSKLINSEFGGAYV